MLRAGDGTVAFRARDATVTVRVFAEGRELDRDDPAKLRAAGATLAVLHNAGEVMLADRPVPSPWHAALWPGDYDPPALRDPELDAWHQAFTDDPGGRLARGLVHGDFWAGNIIWGGGRVAAVIDFSEARVDVLARELGAASSTATTTPRTPSGAGVTVLDVMLDIKSGDWPPFDRDRLERYVEGVLARIP